MRAVTDTGPTSPNSPKSEPVENLFSLLRIVSTPDTVQYFEDQYNSMQIRYCDLKKQLAEDIIKFTAPIRERILQISSDKDYLHKAAKLGTEKAKASAQKTIRDVREIIGFKAF